ncbi:MAG: DinB family protein [Planctomycetota bacterium]|jgi:hypothetical protein
MKDDVIRSFAMSLEHARHLLRGVEEGQMVLQPIEGMNHPAWIIGHLVYSFQAIGGEIGLAPWLPSDWQERFGTGTKLPTGSEQVPGRAELSAALDDGEKRLTDRLSEMSEEDLAESLPDERLRHVFPTIGGAVMHILTVHTAVHVGQLSAWRRAMGLPRVADPI